VKTEQTNSVKQEIDAVKEFLDNKLDQKKTHAMHQSMAPGFNSHTDGFDMDSPPNETEIIDEEELKQLKTLKELKSQYRSLFKELKELRNGSAYTQQAIDNTK